MTTRRWIRVLLVPALSFVLAGFLLWQGIRILASPSATNPPYWFGWLLLAIATFKVMLWSFLTASLIRHPEAIMAARHWD